MGEDDGAELEADQRIEYERNDLRECVDYLAQFPQAKIANEIDVSVRAWRSCEGRVAAAPDHRGSDLTVRYSQTTLKLA